MPRRTSYRHGAPNWVDLHTTDLDAAKSYYGRLFGWTFNDVPTAQGPAYSLCTMNGGVVAGIAAQPPETAAQSRQSTWRTYLAVDDVDAAAAKVEAAGGNLLVPPLDATEAGRTAFASDPTGVTVGLWQAKARIGATIVNEPGAYTWSELMTDDRDTALAFYKDVFGLTAKTVDMAGSPFTGLIVGEDMVGGIIPPQREGVEHRWIAYFAVANAYESAERAERLGGMVVHGPLDTPVGPLAALRDPQGAAFSIWAFNTPST
ncbi:VOC family protein [Streptomyces sp. NPDC001165]|uniref:VOC family protein n=1 Tax=Streptomyces sp. NPDC001165 TaxID=3364546 RepID=UPI0036BFEDE3